MHGYWQVEACLRAVQKTATYRSPRFYQLAALVLSASAIPEVDLGLHCGCHGIHTAERARLWARRTKVIFTKENTPMNNENLTLHFKLKDFNTWQTSYNGNEKNRTSAGITKSKVFRSTDDPNDVLLLQDVADVSKARTWYNSSEMKSVMEKSGVVGSPIIRVAA
jgi:hypothetical protein